MSDMETIENQEGESDVERYILERAENNIGAVKVLSDLYKRFREEDSTLEVINKKFYQIADRLGRGGEIWRKYKVDCREDIDFLIKYADTIYSKPKQ